MEHGHEPQRNGVIGITILVSGLVLLVFFIAGNAYFETARYNVDYEIRLSAPNPALQELHTRETIALEGYAWVDQEKGQVSIPIEEAMDRVVADYGKAADGQ